MTALLEPFTGFIPVRRFAYRIVGPPVSMLSPDQREVARTDPLSFRHVVGRGAGSSHGEAQEWLRYATAEGALRRFGPGVLVYQIAKGDLVAVGIICDVSLSAYDSGRVKRHETTIAKTERKMADYMKTTRIYGNPVALAHRGHPAFEEVIAAYADREPDLTFIAADGFAHTMWAVEGQAARDLCAEFNDVLYITDGHHRLAAASAVAADEGRPDPHLPAGLFAADQMRLRSFARCVVDPEADLKAVVAQLRSSHRLEKVSQVEARPRGRHDFGVRIGGTGYRLHIDPDRVPADRYRALDVNLLQDLVLEPLFGITNPRQDRRLRFIADMAERDEELSSCSAYFLPFPVAVPDVLAIADMGLAMPPKSTWFAPKLPSGLVIRLLDG